MSGKLCKRESRRIAAFYIFFIIAICFYEITALLVTKNTVELNGILLPFSVSVGIFIATLILLTGKWFYVTSIVVLSFCSLFFVTQTVLFRTFGYFYPPETIFDMADDVVGSFGKTAVSSVLSSLPIVLFFSLPPFAFAYFFRRRRNSLRPKKLVCLITLIFLSLTSGFVFHFLATSTLKDSEELTVLYGAEYDFNNASKQFGFLTSLRLSIQYSICGQPDFSVPEDNTADTTNYIKDSAEKENYNVENIDLQAMEELSENKNIKALCRYFRSKKATAKNEKSGLFKDKNLIFICAEALSPYAISPTLTPTLFKLSNEGFRFSEYYSPSFGESTSGGEYSLLLSQVPKRDAGEKGLSMNLASNNDLSYSLPGFFANNNYSSNGYHNNSYTYYNRNKTHTSLGMNWYGCGGCALIDNNADNFDIGKLISNGWPRSDLEMISVTAPRYITQSKESGKPFFTYYMTVSGHNNYSFTGNKISEKNRVSVSDISASETVKAYLATQIELDLALEELLKQLDANGISENTVIVIANDHYPYGLSADWSGNNGIDYISELYGKRIKSASERERGTLMIYCKGITNGERVEKPISSFDVLPTLLNLFGMEFDSRFFCGRDAFSSSDGLVFFSDGSIITNKFSYNSANGDITAKSALGYSPTPDEISDLKRNIRSAVAFSKSVRQNDFFAYLNRKKLS